MADKFINETGLQTIKTWIDGKFSTKTDIQQIQQEIDEIVAQGGEPNVIETVKVDGTALTPDASKAVNIDLSGKANVDDIPINTSDLTNDGDGTTPFATTAVATTSVDGLMSSSDKTKLESVESGAESNIIETVKVNGTPLVPDAQKAVDVTVPTKTSDLTNDDNVVKDASYVHTDNNYTTAEKEKLAAVEAGAEVNVIEIVKVNGTALVPDAQKAVDVTVPTATSDLTNDGDGTSNFATEAYVDTNGGKIDTISVNGTQQTITNKNVDITVPTQVSDLTNDSNFQTQTEVQSAISQAVASAYKYKGSVATYADLPSSGQTAGDVWDVQETGVNYAWTGTSWDALGNYVDTSLYWTNQSGQNNSLNAMTVAEINAILEPSA